MQTGRRRLGQRSRSPLKWEHDLFKDPEKQQEQELDTMVDEDNDNSKWRQANQKLTFCYYHI